MKDTASVTTLEEAQVELAGWKRKRQRAREKLARAESFIRHYEQQVQFLSLPPEPDEGRVVSFVKSYQDNLIVYKFAAVRGGGRWWVTGDAPVTKHGITWAQLIDFARSGNVLLGNHPPKLMVAEDDVAPPF